MDKGSNAMDGRRQSRCPLPLATHIQQSVIKPKFELRRLIERLLYSMLCAAVRTPSCLADPLKSSLIPWVFGTVQHVREYVLDPRWRQVVHGVFLRPHRRVDGFERECEIVFDKTLIGHKYAHCKYLP